MFKKDLAPIVQCFVSGNQLLLPLQRSLLFRWDYNISHNLQYTFDPLLKDLEGSIFLSNNTGIEKIVLTSLNFCIQQTSRESQEFQLGKFGVIFG